MPGGDDDLIAQDWIGGNSGRSQWVQGFNKGGRKGRYQSKLPGLLRLRHA